SPERSSPASRPGRSLNGEWDWCKGQHKKGDCRPADPDACAAEQRLGIAYRWMGQADDARHAGPEKPARPTEKAERQENRDRRECDAALAPAPHRIDDVAAVELADRNQVQRRHEQSEPGRERHWMEHDVVAVWNRTKYQPRDELQQQRLP